MTVIVGYLAVTALCVLAIWAIAGRRFEVIRDHSANLSDVAGRHTGIMSGLAGFAVTGMVLLVTLGRSLLDTDGNAYTTVVTMFFVSWMAYSGTAFLFANIVDAKVDPGVSGAKGFDVAAGQFAGAASTLEFAFGLAWLALRPLFQAFELSRLADLVAYTSIIVAPISYGLVANHLRRSGYGPDRILIAVPVLTVVGVLAYALIVNLLGIRSDEAALDLIIGGFTVGAFAFLGVITLNVTAAHNVSARFLSRFGRYLILGYVQSIVLFNGFLLLAILGLA
jgi:hypothetical protein